MSKSGSDGSVVLLLGAGASVDAGCPTVRQLTDSFLGNVSSRDRAALQWIVGCLTEDGSASPDIETILSALRELQNREKHPLAAFVHRSGWRSEVNRFDSAFPRLEQQLQRHIREEVSVRRDNVVYLRPLLDLVPADGVLDVFTLNYDYAIELMCQEAGIQYTDGFATYWDPRQFDILSSGIRLHKLHGSLLWYQTARPPRRVVKIPISGSGDGLVRFFSDDEVSASVIYPTLVKEQHVEPYATLLSRFRDKLSHAALLVCIGYSFRDGYLKDLIVEKMYENQEFRLLVIDPSAADVLRASDLGEVGSWRFELFRNRIDVSHESAASALAEQGLGRRITVGGEAEALVKGLQRTRLGGTPVDRIARATEALLALAEAGRWSELFGLFEFDGLDWIHASDALPADEQFAFRIRLVALTTGTADARRRSAEWVQARLAKYLAGVVIDLADGRLKMLGGEAAGLPSSSNPQALAAWFGERVSRLAGYAVEAGQVSSALKWCTAAGSDSLAQVAADLDAVSAYWASGSQGAEWRNFNQFGGEKFRPLPSDVAVRRRVREHLSDESVLTALRPYLLNIRS